MAMAARAVPERPTEVAPLDALDLSDDSLETSESKSESEISLTDAVPDEDDELLVLKRFELLLLLLLGLLVGLAEREERPLVPVEMLAV
ncbi:hypothetical protein GGH92_009188, partial [Coemansia sp. RSA 2673]